HAFPTRRSSDLFIFPVSGCYPQRYCSASVGKGGDSGWRSGARQRPGEQYAQHGNAEHDCNEVERIIVGHDLRLLAHLAVEQTQGCFAVAQLVGQQCQPLPGGRVADADVAAEDVEVMGSTAVRSEEHTSELQSRENL